MCFPRYPHVPTPPPPRAYGYTVGAVAFCFLGAGGGGGGHRQFNELGELRRQFVELEWGGGGAQTIHIDLLFSTEKLTHCRTVFEQWNKNLASGHQCGEYLSLDETLYPCRTNVNFKQYNPSKVFYNDIAPFILHI